MTKPKSLKDALAIIETQQKDVEQTKEVSRNEYHRRLTAEKEATVTREQFADLKQKLYDAEIELAKLRGFIDRVREDDAVRDPLVEVVDDRGTRQVTKRFPSNSPMMRYTDGGAGYGGETPGFGGTYYGHEKQKPKHWTSY